MEHLRSILPKVLQKRGLQKHVLSSLVIEHTRIWLSENTFSDDMAVAKTYKDKLLSIEVEHSIIAQELQMQIPVLKEYLQEKGHPIQEIRIVRK